MAMQKLAAVVHCDGIQDDSLIKLAQLGTWGLHTSNVHRQLLTYANKGNNLPEPTFIQAPALDSKSHPPQIVCEFPILLPHEHVANLAEFYPERFATIFGSHKINDFWSGANPSDPRLLRNPIEGADRSNILPIWIHGDGVELGCDSLMLFSLGSMLCSETL